MQKTMMIAGLVLAAAAAARAESATPLRLADVLAEARARNPEIAAARARSRAAAEVPAQAAAWDDPVLSWEAWNVPESLRVDQADNNIFRLSQRIPFPGKRRLAGAAAAAEARMAEGELASVELDVVAAVKRAYYELWQLHQTLAVYERDMALVRRFAHVAEQKYAVGEATQSDALRARVELTRLVNRVATERLAIEAARAELAALVSRGADELAGVPEDPTPPRLPDGPEPLVGLALAHRPELAAQAALLAREQQNVRLAERSYYPDFELSVSRFQNFELADGFGAFASVTIPLAYRAKYDAALDEAKARLAAAEAERRRAEDRVRREVTQALLRARAALAQRDLFVTTHVPLAEQALRVTESAYRSGTVDFLALTDSVRAIEGVHVEHLAAEGALEKAWADLERAVGTRLEREGAS
jgi:outer membrane protein TolC